MGLAVRGRSGRHASGRPGAGLGWMSDAHDGGGAHGDGGAGRRSSGGPGVGRWAAGSYAAGVADGLGAAGAELGHVSAGTGQGGQVAGSPSAKACQWVSNGDCRNRWQSDVRTQTPKSPPSTHQPFLWDHWVPPSDSYCQVG